MNEISDNAHNEKFGELIFSANNIVIAGHVKPDGDCIGACLALGLGFKAIGKNAVVLLEDYGVKYDFIPGKELIYKGDTADLNPDIFIACDCGSKDRLGSAAELFDRSKIKLNLDHHVTNDNFADYNLVVPKASSTCEMVFNVISHLMPITPEIGVAICAGILYDTGGLRHKSTTAETLMLTSKLHSQNVPISNIFNSLLFERTFIEAKMYSRAIEKMVLNKEHNIISSAISLSDMKEFGATSKDLDGIVEFLAEIKEAETAVFIYEREDGSLKVSMRSKATNVGKVANKLGGGGHHNAAGFSSSGSFAETLEKTVSLIECERQSSV